MVLGCFILLQERIVFVSSFSSCCDFKQLPSFSRSFGVLHAVDSSHLRGNLDDQSNNNKKNGNRIKTTGIYSSNTAAGYMKLKRQSELYLYNHEISVENNVQSSSFRKSRRKKSIQMQLLKPVKVIYGPCFTTIKKKIPNTSNTSLDISSGLTFDNGEQLLVSAQKPLGLILEERSAEGGSGCIVAQVTPGSVADRSGIRKGDLLIAVQNVDVEDMTLEDVMEKILSAPKVVNLRFWRGGDGT